MKSLNGSGSAAAAKTDAPEFVKEKCWPDQTTSARKFACNYFVKNCGAELFILGGNGLRLHISLKITSQWTSSY